MRAPRLLGSEWTQDRQGLTVLCQIKHTSGTLHRDVNWIVGKQHLQDGGGRGQKEPRGQLYNQCMPQAPEKNHGAPNLDLTQAIAEKVVKGQLGGPIQKED